MGIERATDLDGRSWAWALQRSAFFSHPRPPAAAASWLSRIMPSIVATICGLH